VVVRLVATLHLGPAQGAEVQSGGLQLGDGWGRPVSDQQKDLTKNTHNIS
jgi:hypothetical protein